MFSHQSIYVDDLEYIAQLELPWNQLKDTRILITGASGMIGTFLVDALLYKSNKENLNIRIYASGRNGVRAKERFKEYWNQDNFIFMEQDVNTPFNMDKKADYIFHCASNTHPKQYSTDPIGTIMTNILGTKNILDCAV